ncbi:MAG: hypothetical protein UV59_C0024G0003 [Candidatus Gottesmanbacteria bacterium GW2011_GWA1_43_11]|uniref:Uncharacterized protein n=1 Tax=Candidatus Gottesmanbacteria bacterium GW2011_GWA1_43_11 TaxID=1618436 RepID=A0A0G1CFA1_9BACT|nr:MAG: hypothetical protein UV59_C0024G0003 [Candidatus Gottesmanbacteria bacterium GW2011_GWA1_43_11]
MACYGNHFSQYLILAVGVCLFYIEVDKDAHVYTVDDPPYGKTDGQDTG